MSTTHDLPPAIPARHLYFLVLPHVHLLDLSGAAQVFYEASSLGADYSLHFCAVQERIASAQGLMLSELDPLPEVQSNDLVLVPGIDSDTLDDLDHVPGAWLREAYSVGAQICSICSGAFALARAGLLDSRRCTTHWKVADRLQEDYPAVKLVRDRLFVRDRGVTTSAGVASGIDMSLSLVEEDYGPLVVARVAREIVVYLRRNGRAVQTSVYLDYRTHLHPGVHRIQDWLVAHPDTKATLQELADIAGMSPRSLTRTFKQATGVTLKTFTHKLKLEVASNLLHNPELTLEGVSHQCGFEDPRQLRRLWQANYGMSPSQWRSQQQRRN